MMSLGVNDPSTQAGAIARYAAHSFAKRAERVLPGGNTRSTLFVPPSPPYAVSGQGSWVLDQLGHSVLDCNNNYTSLIHGHAHPGVMAPALHVAGEGTAYGLPTLSEVELAEVLQERTGQDQWRFCNSGTEAVMMAMRAARAATGRDVIVRFAGSYHGTSDGVVSSSAAGIPTATSSSTVEVPQGDRTQLEKLFRDSGELIAGVLIDLMPNRAGLVPADREFVAWLREATRSHGILLVVDEVITFRLAAGGLHQRYDIRPDLITLGKVIGGGFPVGAVGGNRQVMNVFAPSQPRVAWGGTFSANPVTMTAGIHSLSRYQQHQIDLLNSKGDLLRQELIDDGVVISGDGSLLRLREEIDPADLWWGLYLGGVMVGTNGLIALSTPMTDADLAHVRSTVTSVVRRLRGPRPTVRQHH